MVPCTSCCMMSADVSSELTGAPSALDQIQLELESVNDIEPPVQELQLEPILAHQYHLSGQDIMILHFTLAVMIPPEIPEPLKRVT